MVSSIGYVLGRRLWNRGLVSEALMAVLHELAQSGGIRRAYDVYDVENPASGRVMANAGMKLWGRIPKAIVHPGAGADRRDIFLYEKGF